MTDTTLSILSRCDISRSIRRHTARLVTLLLAGAVPLGCVGGDNSVIGEWKNSQTDDTMVIGRSRYGAIALDTTVTVPADTAAAGSGDHHYDKVFVHFMPTAGNQYDVLYRPADPEKDTSVHPMLPARGTSCTIDAGNIVCADAGRGMPGVWEPAD